MQTSSRPGARSSCLAVYPGSFDPITNGHVHIAERAAAIFSKVRVSVLTNAQKDATFTIAERRAMAEEALAHLPNVTVDHFEGLLVDHVRRAGAHVIVRGLRAMSDFEYEFQMALMNRQLAPEIETFFIVTDTRWSYVSSSVVREVFSLGGTVSGMVPDCVLERLRERFPLPPTDEEDARG
ncbi:MAG: pantetheine-phosphate adenylyltransferase [Synergistaceae bacterium]|nr:pantetheine-phosphate adenylyltransferase [Synergistaceae bacterium]